MLTARSGGGGRDYQGGMQQETLGDRPGSGLRGSWVVWWVGQAPAAPSGRKWQRSESSEGVTELGFPGPTLWQMQSEAAGRAGEPSGNGEEAPPEGLGGYYLLAQTDASCPASQVVRHHLDGQPGGVGGGAFGRVIRRSHVRGGHSRKPWCAVGRTGAGLIFPCGALGRVVGIGLVHNRWGNVAAEREMVKAATVSKTPLSVRRC